MILVPWVLVGTITSASQIIGGHATSANGVSSISSGSLPIANTGYAAAIAGNGTSAPTNNTGTTIASVAGSTNTGCDNAIVLDETNTGALIANTNSADESQLSWMTITILGHTDRGDTKTASGGATPATLDSASFQPAVGALIVASIACALSDGGGGAGSYTMSSTNWTTGGWTVVEEHFINDGGTFDIKTIIAWAVVLTSPSAGVARATYNSATSGSGAVFLQVDEWVNQAAVPIGLHNSVDDARASGSTLTVGFGGAPVATSGAVGIVIDNNGSTTGAVQPSGWIETSDVGDPTFTGTSSDAAYIITGAQASPQWTSLQSGTFGKTGSVAEILSDTAATSAPATTSVSRDRDRTARRDFPAFQQWRLATRGRRAPRSQFELYRASSTISTESHTSSAKAALGLNVTASQAHAGATSAVAPLGLSERTTQAGAHASNATAPLALSERATQVKSVADSVKTAIALVARALQLRSVADSVKTALGLSASASDVKSGSGKATAALALTETAAQSTARVEKAAAALGLTTRAIQLKSASSSSQEALALTARGTQSSNRVQSAKAVLGLTERATQLKSVTDAVKAALGLTATVNKVGGAIQGAAYGALGLTASLLQATGRAQAARAVLALAERTTQAKGAVDAAQGAVGLTGRTIDSKSSAQSTSNALGLAARVTTAKKAITTARGAVGLTAATRGVRSATTSGAKAVITLVARAFGIQVTFVADPDPILVTWYESGPISWSEAAPLQGVDRYVINYEEDLR